MYRYGKIMYNPYGKKYKAINWVHYQSDVGDFIDANRQTGGRDFIAREETSGDGKTLGFTIYREVVSR